MLARVEHRHDVAVRDPAGRAGLAVEALAEDAVGRELASHQLESHVLAVRAHRLVDEAHPALAQAGLDLVGPDGVAGLQVRDLVVVLAAGHSHA